MTTPVAWLDADGKHIWFAHDCTEYREVTMLPYPFWSTVTGLAAFPSVSCGACGFHEHMEIADPPPPLDALRARTNMRSLRARVNADRAILDRLADGEAPW